MSDKPCMSTHKHTDTDTDTDTHTHTETHRQTDRHTHTQAHTHTDTLKHTRKCVHFNITISVIQNAFLVKHCQIFSSIGSIGILYVALLAQC